MVLPNFALLTSSLPTTCHVFAAGAQGEASTWLTQGWRGKVGLLGACGPMCGHLEVSPPVPPAGSCLCSMAASLGDTTGNLGGTLEKTLHLK